MNLDLDPAVTFVCQDEIRTMVAIPDAFKFQPAGRWAWLQKKCWAWLHRAGALEQAQKPTFSYKRHIVDSDRFMDLLLKQRRNLLDGYRTHGQRLLIGTEDYFRLMDETPIHEHFSFDAQVGMGREILGLTVEVIPWMRGCVVMP